MPAHRLNVRRKSRKKPDRNSELPERERKRLADDRRIVAGKMAEKRRRTGPVAEPDLTGVKPSAGPGGIFLPDNLQLVRYAAMRGHVSDEMLADYFNVSAKTIALWRERFPEFERAIDEGYCAADAEVLASMYQTAVGFEYEEEQAVGGKVPDVLTVKRRALPQLAAQREWLRFRRNDFRDSSTTQRFEHTGKNGGPIDLTQETKSSVISSILAMVQPKPDGK